MKFGIRGSLPNAEDAASSGMRERMGGFLTASSAKGAQQAALLGEPLEISTTGGDALQRPRCGWWNQGQG